jgi:hypothetical protein
LAWSQRVVQGGLRKDVLAPGGWGPGAVKVGSPLKSWIAPRGICLGFVAVVSTGQEGKSASILDLQVQTSNCRSSPHHPTPPPSPTIQPANRDDKDGLRRPLYAPSRLPPVHPIHWLPLWHPVRWVDPRQPVSKRLRQRRLCIIESVSQISSHQRSTLNSSTATRKRCPTPASRPPSNLEPPAPRASRPCSTRFPDRARRLPDHPATKRDCRAQRPRRRPA